MRTRLVVEIPDDRTELSGSMTCEVELRRSFGAWVRGVPAVAAKEKFFTTGIPRQHGGPAVRLLVSCDIVGFGARPPGGTARTQHATAEVLDRAAAATGIALDDRQEGGDSLLLTFPPAIDERQVLRAFYLELCSALRGHNRDLTPRAAIRLRIGIDRGLTDHNALGWDRAAPIAAVRLRDCAAARKALRDNPTAPFVLVVSDVLHRDIFGDPDHDPPGTAFTAITIEEPDKSGFTAEGWLYLVPSDDATSGSDFVGPR